MNYSYENQGSNTYLVYTVGENEVIDTMTLGMLTNNKIQGLASAFYTQLDTTRYIKYNITAQIPAQQIFAGPVNKSRFIGIFSGIVNAVIAAEDYMIDMSSMVFDLNYIFVDVSTNETELICLPILNENACAPDVGTFFKNIVFSIQFDQSENCDYIAKIINHLNSSPIFSIQEFKKVLDDIKGNKQEPVGQVMVKKPAAQSQKVVETQSAVQATKSIVSQPTVPSNNMSTNVPHTPVIPSSSSVEPGQKVVAQRLEQPVNKEVKSIPVEETKEKKISMLNLLMHYNKENAAAYKAQKDAKKVQGANLNAKQNVQSTQPAFAIPGQPIPPIVSQKEQAKVPTAVPPKNMNTVTQKQQDVSKEKSQDNISMSIPGNQVNVSPTVVPTQPTFQHNTVMQTPQNFGETVVLSESKFGETTVLGVSNVAVQTTPHLIRMKNNERIDLNKPVFRIGKEKSYVDYFISDNTAISRSHANFISRDGEYSVVDTNSTNHTYVNGIMIQSNSETKLKHGDKVRLANEEFEFKLR